MVLFCLVSISHSYFDQTFPVSEIWMEKLTENQPLSDCFSIFPDCKVSQSKSKYQTAVCSADLLWSLNSYPLPFSFVKWWQTRIQTSIRLLLSKLLIQLPCLLSWYLTKPTISTYSCSSTCLFCQMKDKNKHQQFLPYWTYWSLSRPLLYSKGPTGSEDCFATAPCN